MNASFPKKGLGTWLFNPFVYIAGWQALLLGFAAILVTCIIGAFGHTHFDGVLDMHSGRPAPLWIFIFEGLIDWLSLGLVLLVLGKLISKTKFRSIDLLGTQAMARWPFIICSLITLPDAVRQTNVRVTESLKSSLSLEHINPSDMAILVGLSIATLLVTCWFVFLAYRSFSVSCNVKGGKAIVTFIIGILVAEVLSKFAIMLLFKSL